VVITPGSVHVSIGGFQDRPLRMESDGATAHCCADLIGRKRAPGDRHTSDPRTGLFGSVPQRLTNAELRIRGRIRETFGEWLGIPPARRATFTEEDNRGT
jgi:hypothetical protein